jgi:hypothetical protein
LKPKVLAICLISLTIALAAISSVNFAAAATTPTAQTSTAQTTPVVSATGNGWINPSGKPEGFSFYARGGTMKADGWRYNPNAQASFTGSVLGSNKLIQVWSTRVWRYNIDTAGNSKRVIIAGTATVKVGQELKSNWWFRITAQDTTVSNAKDAFMIQLWRPIGANNVGGWSPNQFTADKPGSLQLNTAAFYQAQGPLKGGNIVIKP